MPRYPGDVPSDEQLRRRPGRFSRGQYLSIAQGLYYLVTGIWPLLSISSFQRVTGPKTDLWLVKTIGTLISVTGIVLLRAGFQRRVTPEVAALGAGSAIAFTSIDVYYVARRTISPVYLLDALGELFFIAAWPLSAVIQSLDVQERPADNDVV